VLSDYGEDLPISTSGAFTFATRFASGAGYDITVKTSPASPPQLCQIANGTGGIPAANVTNVDVTCSSSYTVRITVSGLQGSGLVLQLADPGTGGPRVPGKPGHNIGPPLQITSNGSFSVVEIPPTVGPGLVASISQQPASPDQTCQVTGNINRQAPSSDVEVACSQHLYVTNAADNTVSAYVIDAASGALTAVGTPVATGTSPHAIAFNDSVDGIYLYVANEGSNDISIFNVDFLSSALTSVAGSPVTVGTDPRALAISGACLGVANAGSDTISTFYAWPPAAGGVKSTSPDSVTGKGPSSLVVDGQFLYVANNGGSNDISVVSQDPTCALTAVPGSPFPAGASPLSMVLGAGGKYLYTANPDATTPSISGFSVDPNTGALSPLSGSPFPLPVSHGMATDQSGGYLYITSGAGIVGYAINAISGALTALPGFPVAAGANAYSITIDPSNQFLYVANDGAASISGFRRDATTGALTPMAGSPFPSGSHPAFIAAF
jgi:YVTN family beta-propeller protein